MACQHEDTGDTGSLSGSYGGGSDPALGLPLTLVAPAPVRPETIAGTSTVLTEYRDRPRSRPGGGHREQTEDRERGEQNPARTSKGNYRWRRGRRPGTDVRMVGEREQLPRQSPAWLCYQAERRLS